MTQLDLIAGEAFARSARSGTIPPGPLFINRFLHADPSSWNEKWHEVRANVTDAEAVQQSIRQLVAMLGDVASKGAPGPIVGAAEEAVRINMTAHAVQLGAELVDAIPTLRSHPEFQEHFPGWATEAAVDTSALAIREACSALDVACAGHPKFAERPDMVVVTLAAMMREEMGRLSTLQPDQIAAEAGGPASMDDGMTRQMGRMMRATDWAKQP